MKRDMELIRKIMLFLEEQINPSIRNVEIPGIDEHVINYHIVLLIEAELIQGNVSRELGPNPAIPNYVRVYRVTWQGHEFIDNFRNEEIWNTFKTEFKEMSFSSLTTIGKQLVEGIAKSKLEVLLKASETSS
ncbi:conserved hypothetical protein [Vibrio chagasii]|nr:conserved hypothetical protein [Vibrio chagasii]CAH6910792.1 conserved hypothetical protein [Vibrio chagasii]CAH7091871.1 conserved hypothetical protein [Vibrio chagasii]CAH7221152.1 conserved hypothetical protein [Vibrio chagasii]CAH7445718.1 conserved hypothetical protein [Vibrio chagasii]